MISFTFYSPPNGEIFYNPDLNFLETLVLYGEGLYWNSGAGQANIDIEDEQLSKTLLINFDSKFGFCFKYDDLENPILVSSNNKSFDEVTTLHIGGVAETLPAKFFVLREQAWRIIEFFCETGNLLDEIEWLTFKDQKWT